MRVPVAPCPLGVDAATLSAWRDGLLAREEAARLVGHVSGCAACRASLSEFESTAAILLSQRTPNLRESVWRGTQARIVRGPASKRDGRPPRVLFSGVGAAAAVLLVVALFAVLLAHGRGPASGPLPGTATATHTQATQPAATMTTTPPTGTLPADWHVAALYEGDAAVPVESDRVPSLLFAPSNRAIGYACTRSGNTGALIGTTDGGQHWRTLASVCAGSNGNTLSVDPTNPNDILLSEITPPGVGGYAVVLFRSTDGGHTWAQQDMRAADGLSLTMMSWAGSTPLLSLSPAESGSPTPFVGIMASFGGGPFVRLDSNGAIAGHQTSDLSAMTGNAQEIILGISDSSGSFALVSTNQGKNWTQEHMWRYAGADVTSALFSADGQLALGAVTSGQTTTALVTTDAGQTWQPIPTFAGSAPLDGQSLAVLPDGSVYATTTALNVGIGTPDQNIYTTHPGATTWTSVATLPTLGEPVAYTWDAQGHGTVFASYMPDPNSPQAELIWHALP